MPHLARVTMGFSTASLRITVNPMKSLEHPDDEPDSIRAHPWSTALADPAHRYYNFRLEPELIRKSLEDFLPLAKWPAITRFYELVEWINSEELIFESNDCGTRGPGPNKIPKFAKPRECTARLMILFRDLKANLSFDTVTWLAGAVRHYLNQTDLAFEWGVIGTTVRRSQYVSLPPPESAQMGPQLMLTFWAWGDTDSEVMDNLGRSFENVQEALSNVANEIRETLQSRQ